VLILVYVVVFSVLSVLKHDTFHSYTYDLGIMSQVLWNTAHGRWFETSIGRARNAELIGSYLGNHVRPVLVLLAPLYRLWPDPRLLLVLQSIALGLAAVPLYWIARKKIDHTLGVAVIVCCYLIYPALGHLNLFDFHPVALSIPLLFVAYWALEERRMPLFWVAVVLVLSTKEELVVPIGVWGIVNLLRSDRRGVGLGLLALAGGWAIACFWLIIPAFNEGRPYRFFALWAHLPQLLKQPSSYVGTPAGDTSFDAIVQYLVHLFLPLGFTPVLGPRSLVVALPSLAYLLLGSRPSFRTIGYQYPAILIPWLLLASIEGLQWLRGHCACRVGKILHWAAVLAMLLGSAEIQRSMNPIVQYVRHGGFQRDPYHDQMVQALSEIPPGAGVATINRFGAHLTQRRYLVPLEYPEPFRLDFVLQTDYVFLDLVDCRAVVAANPRARYGEMIRQVLETGEFRVRYWWGRVLLLERGAMPPDEHHELVQFIGELVERNEPCWP
jgi:uncharacterized membrane protein